MSTYFLDKVGSVGAVIAGAAVPCCFPFLGVIGGIIGLSFLSPYEEYVMWALQGLVVLAFVGSLIAYRGHRKFAPLLIAAASTGSILYAANTDLNTYLLYGGMAGLLIVAVWNTVEGRRCAAKCQ